MMQALQKGKVGEIDHNMVLKEAFKLVYDYVEEVIKMEKDPDEEDSEQEQNKKEEDEEVKSQKCLTLKSLRVLEGKQITLVQS